MQDVLLFIREVLEYLLVPLLLTTGLLLTFRLKFIQFRKFWHGIQVVRGKYDDPNAKGEVSHFQALTTALSATVGIGNIAGVAIAIHWGGPGAIFWMWITAVLGMATKFAEVSLAQHFRVKGEKGIGVSGGPMYYIEKGLGKRWKPMAMFFAFSLMTTAFITGNAVQSNTLSDLMNSEFQIPVWITGAVSAALVGTVIIGGISRIGKVTGILAPSMAALYILGGLAVLVYNADQIFPTFELIVKEAFNPTAGIAGTGTGVFLQTLIWGVRRGLFSNEAGQGSAPIAHSAAKTDKPVSEGVVALLEPFIDTILICTITALAILTTGVWKSTTPTQIVLNSGDRSYVEQTNLGFQRLQDLPASIDYIDGKASNEKAQLAWHEVAVSTLYVDEAQQQLFSGTIHTERSAAVTKDGTTYTILYGKAAENGAPLTMWAYEEVLGRFGVFIVILCVMLFGVSTAIAWSYYGDRCAIYLFGNQAIIPYRIVFVIMHFLGAIVSLNLVWDIGDVAMSLGTIPNVIALILLSGVVSRLARDYFKSLK
ncbi:MAG: sodium:alanine symporter family protein [Bacteroidota bacterium]